MGARGAIRIFLYLCTIMFRNGCLRILPVACACALTAWGLASCASIGRPEGGPRDETPPEFVRSTPAPGALNFSGNRIEAVFDENIQLKDAFDKVIVSPVQTTAPSVRSNGRRVTVELRDTLLPNTTYTIDFADAIQDLNEGNILDGFALDFSTGPDIDTLRVSGLVLEARNLEPAQGMTVGLYREPADTTFATTRFERIARTNQLGQFTVRNLKEGRYAVYALNDVNRDNRWDRTEDVAFLGHLVTPYAESITVSDTVRLENGTDSISSRPGTAFFPNDVLLTWFNEGYRAQYLKDYKRPERRKIFVQMGAPADSLPQISFVEGPLKGRDFGEMTLLERNSTNDSLTYWIRDPELLAVDSLMLSVRHLNTDSLERLVWQTDTLRFYWREPKKKEKKKDTDADTLPPPVELIDLSMTSNTAHNVYQPIAFKTATPIGSLDTAAVHLEKMVDTVWTAVPIVALRPDSLNPLASLLIDFDTQPGARYRITIDSLGITDISGLHNKTFRQELGVRNLEEYSSLKFTVSPDTVPLVVELLNDSDVPVRTAPAPGGKVTFKYLDPGTYYARLWIDANNNGVWDTGNIRDSIQPEEVYYYPKRIDLKANWDVENTWNIYEQPLDRQKPSKIKKNKPARKAGQTSGDIEDGDIEYDEWGEPIDPTRRNASSRPGSGNRNSFGGLGGRQQSTGNAATPRNR